jgi:hypothetical protein
MITTAKLLAETAAMVAAPDNNGDNSGNTDNLGANGMNGINGANVINGANGMNGCNGVPSVWPVPIQYVPVPAPSASHRSVNRGSEEIVITEDRHRGGTTTEAYDEDATSITIYHNRQTVRTTRYRSEEA